MAARKSMSSSRDATQVLIVDDERDIREALSDLLEDGGFTVATAENGARALDWIGAHPGSPKVILLDLMMPEMDGLAFLQHRERDAGLRAIPVAVFTANLLAGQEALALGSIEAVLRKPLTWQALTKLLVDRLGLVPASEQRQAR